MLARSGIVAAARAWKVMLDVPEIKMASVWGWRGSASSFRNR